MTAAPATPFCKTLLEQNGASSTATELVTLRSEVARLTAALDKANACTGIMLASQFKEERAALVARQSRSALRDV